MLFLFHKKKYEKKFIHIFITLPFYITSIFMPFSSKDMVDSILLEKGRIEVYLFFYDKYQILLLFPHITFWREFTFL